MNTEQKKNYIWIILTAFCFGTMEIALKLAGTSFSALQLTFLRFLIGGLVLLPFAIADLRKKHYKLSISDVLYLLVLGTLCICISMTLFQVGVMRTNANLAAIIISCNPVFTMIFAHFLVNDHFTKRKAISLVMSLLGLIIVANPMSLMEGNDFSGILFVLVAAISFGLYTAMGKLRVNKIGGPAQNCFSFLLGCAVQLIILLAAGEPVIEGIHADNLGLLLYIGFVVTGFGYFCYLRAIEVSGPSNASFAFFLKPILAVVLAAVVLSERITINVIVGMVLILGGCILNLKKK